jgi:hypothetical protein
MDKAPVHLSMKRLIVSAVLAAVAHSQPVTRDLEQHAPRALAL